MDTVARIKQIIDQRGINHWDLSRNATGDKAKLHHMFNGRRNARIDTIESLLKEMNCRIEIVTPDDDLSQPAEAYTDIPLIGTAENGTIANFGYNDEFMQAPRPFASCVALLIKGQALSPVYNHNDVVLLTLAFTPAEQAINNDAVCQLKNNDVVLGRVMQAGKDNYNIMPYHPSYPSFSGVKVKTFYKIIGCLKDVQPLEEKQEKSKQNNPRIIFGDGDNNNNVGIIGDSNEININQSNT